MSARRRHLIVRSEAQEDIREILLYTLAHWSDGQRRRYRGELDRAMRALLVFPERGPARDDLFPGCRNLSAGQHLVFYAISDEAIIVLRVLHGSQNASGRVRL